MRGACFAVFGNRSCSPIGPVISRNQKTLSADWIFGRREGTSIFVLFATTLNCLLYRYASGDDIPLGIFIADRDLPQLESVIGFLIHTHVLRTKLSREITPEQLVARVQKGLLELYDHRSVPFDHVVRKLQPMRSPSHSPLFQVSLNWRDSAQQLAFIGLGDLIVEPLLTDTKTSKFDLGFTVTDAGEELWLEIEYNTDLFDDSRILRMVDHFQRLLEMVVTEPDRPVAELPLLTDVERYQLVIEWNDTGVEYPADKCVHELFEEQVEKTPDAVAVVYEDKELSYGELNRRANQLGHYLRKLGVRPDVRVGICVERGLEMVVALLGVLKAGGAYVPLDPGYPVERLRFMLEDSAAGVLLTQVQLRGLFAEINESLPVLDLSDAAAVWQDEAETNADRAAVGLTPEHLAYVIYTSGSTGLPKGVAVAHRSLDNLIHWHRKAFALKFGQRSSSVAGIGFDAATWEIWPVLCVGAVLLLAWRGDAQDPEALLAWWEDQNLDVSFLPTPIAEFAFMRGISNAHLQTLLVGGDRLRHFPLNPLPFALVNNYGPTEATVVATSGHIEVCAPVLSIGRPIRNTRVYILDGYGEPVPMGVVGELYIGGAGVARGYLKRPELTAERFVPDSFVEEAGERLYRTGDLGRWLEDGTIEFVGRNDFQVKIRGYRIELGEIEARLQEHAGVGDAVVIAREDTVGEKRLVAYYTAGEAEGRPGGEAKEAVMTAEQLRAHLAGKLPEYMVPAAYVRLEAMPLTVNGKLDRKSLPVPEGDAYAVRGYEAPEGEVETTLAGIWSELLHVDRIGRHDNFFELGGHSLLAVRVVSRIRQVLGIEVSISDLFAHPVLSGLAEYIINMKLEQFDPTEVAQLLKLM